MNGAGRTSWPDRTGLYHDRMWRSATANRMTLDRWQQRSALETGVAHRHFAPVRRFKAVHRIQPCIEQRVATSQSSNRCFGIVRLRFHALKLTKLRSKTVASYPCAVLMARNRFLGGGTKIRRANFYWTRPPLAVETRRNVADSQRSPDPLFNTSARADSQWRRSRRPRLA